MRLSEINDSLSDFEKKKSMRMSFINETLSDFSKQLRTNVIPKKQAKNKLCEHPIVIESSLDKKIYE